MASARSQVDGNGEQILAVQIAHELAELERRLRKIPARALAGDGRAAGYERRETLEFERGNFLTKTGPALTADVPACFPKLPAKARA